MIVVLLLITEKRAACKLDKIKYVPNTTAVLDVSKACNYYYKEKKDLFKERLGKPLKTGEKRLLVTVIKRINVWVTYFRGCLLLFLFSKLVKRCYISRVDSKFLSAIAS